MNDRKVAGAQEKKNSGESQRMKTRNEAKKKKMAETKVLKSTKLGPENKNRDNS